MIFSHKSLTSIDEKKELLILALDYLNEFTESEPESLIKDQDACEALFYIAVTLAYDTKNIDLDAFSKKHVEIIYGKFLFYFFKIRDQFDIEADRIEYIAFPRKDLSFKQKCVQKRSFLF